MLEKLSGRDIISAHAIGKKVNEIIDVINEAGNVSESPSESDETQTIKNEKEVEQSS